MGNVEDLLREVAAHDGVACARGVREEAVRAIRLLEAKLVQALDGETLRGLPVLTEGRFYGANVRATGRYGIATWLSKDGNDSLVLLKTGGLAMAWRDETAILGAGLRMADESDLWAGDLERVSGVVEEVLRTHLARGVATRGRDSHVRLLATRLRLVLGAA